MQFLMHRIGQRALVSHQALHPALYPPTDCSPALCCISNLLFMMIHGMWWNHIRLWSVETLGNGPGESHNCPCFFWHFGMPYDWSRAFIEPPSLCPYIAYVKSQMCWMHHMALVSRSALCPSLYPHPWPLCRCPMSSILVYEEDIWSVMSCERILRC